jgi:hypothetical protein
MKNTSKHQGLRNQLAKLLEEKGIKDKRVLEAIKKIPRHLFLDSSFEDFAYQDKAFPIAAGQTISQPYTVAFQTQLLEVKRNELTELSTYHEGHHEPCSENPDDLGEDDISLMENLRLAEQHGPNRNGSHFFDMMGGYVNNRKNSKKSKKQRKNRNSRRNLKQ